jgi:branched-chain amino acid transport system permease protein
LSVSTQLIIEQLFNGLVIGSMYALMASGLSLIWGSLKMLNFAHGEFYMLGGYAIFFLFATAGIPAPLAILLAMGIALLIGALIERVVIHPLLDRPGWEISPIIATVGVSIFLQNFALQVWGERFKNVPYYAQGTLTIGDMRISEQRLVILLVAVFVVVAGAILLKRTRLGMALRATAQDSDAATLMGVNVRSVYTWTVGISAGLAALAATMLAPIFSVNPWMGASLLLKAFIVCVLGGLGSLEGAILGGVLLGTAESLTVVLWSSEWKDVTAFALLLIVLWVRPSGLMGTREWQQ